MRQNWSDNAQQDDKTIVIKRTCDICVKIPLDSKSENERKNSTKFIGMANDVYGTKLAIIAIYISMYWIKQTFDRYSNFEFAIRSMSF